MTKAERHALVQTIAAQLGETGAYPIKTIESAVRVCGAELVQAAFAEALTTEAQGGLLRVDGSRRTVGGVFFVLLKQKVRPLGTKIYYTVFPKLVAQNPAANALNWDDRLAAAELAAQSKGVATTARIVVLGRPKEVAARDEFVIVTIAEERSMQKMALPRGLPVLAHLSNTYKVCISNKQWRKVERAIKNPQDMLIVEGFAFPNIKQSTITVMALKTTTKLTEAALKEAQKAQGAP